MLEKKGKPVSHDGKLQECQKARNWMEAPQGKSASAESGCYNPSIIPNWPKEIAP
jgi:hypothetical protein